MITNPEIYKQDYPEVFSSLGEYIWSFKSIIVKNLFSTIGGRGVPYYEWNTEELVNYIMNLIEQEIVFDIDRKSVV